MISTANIRLIEEFCNYNKKPIFVSVLVIDHKVSLHLTFSLVDTTQSSSQPRPFKVAFMKVATYDIAEVKGRWDFMRDIYNLTDKVMSCKVTMNPLKTKKATALLKDFQIPSLNSKQEDSATRKRKQADRSSGRSAKKLKTETSGAAQDHYYSTVVEENEDIERGKPILEIFQKYSFSENPLEEILQDEEVEGGTFTRFFPPHITLGYRNEDGLRVVCKKIADSDAEEVEWLKFFNSDEMRTEPGNIVVELLDVFHYGSHMYVILPFYTPLTDPCLTYFSKELVDKWETQLKEFLGFIHSRGIAHMDLKPSNMGYTENHQDLRIFDLGLMMKADADTLLEDVVGSKSFLPPGYYSETEKWKAFDLDFYASEETIRYLRAFT